MWFPMISWRQLDQWIAQGRDFVLIDLRAPGLYSRSRIRGSRCIPFEELKDRLEELPKDRIIVFCCDRGAKSMLACRRLSDLGWKCVDLAGGMANYRGKFIDRTPYRAIE